VKKPRTAFAAPFVVVLGCGQPHERPRHPEPSEDEEIARPAVIDAAVDAPVDSPPDASTAPIDAAGPVKVSLAEQCKDYQRYRVICNPPRPFRAKVVRVEVQGDAYVVTFDKGSNEGVTKESRIRFVDDLDRKSSAECRIIRVQERQTICRYNSTQPATATVEISSP
jgi:hypothetical protein